MDELTTQAMNRIVEYHKTLKEWPGNGQNGCPHFERDPMAILPPAYLLITEDQIKAAKIGKITLYLNITILGVSILTFILNIL